MNESLDLLDSYKDALKKANKLSDDLLIIIKELRGETESMKQELSECKKKAKWQAMMAEVSNDEPLISREPHPEAILTMSAEELIEYARAEQMKGIMRFIEGCSVKEAAKIIEEIRCVHDNLYAWNPNHKCLDKIDWINIDVDYIQLNIQKDNK